MEVANYPNFIPMTVATNYFEKWDSDVITKH